MKKLLMFAALTGALSAQAGMIRGGAKVSKVVVKSSAKGAAKAAKFAFKVLY